MLFDKIKTFALLQQRPLQLWKATAKQVQRI